MSFLNNIFSDLSGNLASGGPRNSGTSGRQDQNWFDSLMEPFTGGGQALKLSDWAQGVGTPFSQSRPVFEQMLMKLMQDPSTVKNDPGFQFGLDQGLDAVSRKMSSEGFSGSGNEAIELQKFGQGYSEQFMTQQEQFLAYLAGAGVNPNPQPAINAQNNANQQSQNNPLGFGSGGSIGSIVGMFM